MASVHGLHRFIDEKTVELPDGTTLAMDAVIFYTGYEPDFSLTTSFDQVVSTAQTAPGPKNSYQGPPPARLYQKKFSPNYADSLAFVNYVASTDGATTVIDLAAMTIAQIWKGTYKLFSEHKMNSATGKHHEWVKSLARGDSVYCGIVRPKP